MNGKQPTFTQIFRRFIEQREQKELNAYEINRRSNGKIEKTRIWRAIWDVADDELADWCVILGILFAIDVSLEDMKWIEALYEEAREAGYSKRATRQVITEEQRAVAREPQSEPLSPTFQQQKILRNL